MALVQLLPGFTDFYGRLGQFVVVRGWNALYMRRYVAHNHSRSAAQLACRRTFAEAVALWRAMSDAERLPWRVQARRLGRSGYRWFLSRHLTAGVTPLPQIPRISPHFTRPRARLRPILRHGGRTSFASRSDRVSDGYRTASFEGRFMGGRAPPGAVGRTFPKYRVPPPAAPESPCTSPRGELFRPS